MRSLYVCAIISFTRYRTNNRVSDDLRRHEAHMTSLWRWCSSPPVCNEHHPCRVQNHDDVIKWKHFPRYWPFVRGIHRPPVNSLHKGQWRGALKFSLICGRINGWVNNRKAGDLTRCRSHYYDVTLMQESITVNPFTCSGVKWVYRILRFSCWDNKFNLGSKLVGL